MYKKLKYGYCRVSTKCQAADGNSLEAQEKLVRQNGAEVVYSDTCTGTKTDRPQLSKLLSQLQPGDTLIVSKLDRIARNTYHGISLINEILSKNVSVHILNMGLIDNTPTGKLIRTIFLAFAEFERDMIIERTQEGKAIARSNNPHFKEGRPKKYSKEKLHHAMLLLKTMSYNQVSDLTGISKSTLIREKRRIETER